MHALLMYEVAIASSAAMRGGVGGLGILAQEVTIDAFPLQCDSDKRPRSRR